MTDTWRLLHQPEPMPGAWNMAVDEAILESTGERDSLPTLRLYAWNPACLSLGYAQSIQDVDLDKLKMLGWDLVRRPTGGRAVLHVDELTYSIGGPVDEPRLEGTVLDSYQRIAAALLTALQNLNLMVEVQKQRKQEKGKVNPVCFQTPSTYEITLDGKKLIGSAQVRRQKSMLQHGSLPLLGDLSRITQVLRYPNEESRGSAKESLLQDATTVESALGVSLSWEQASQAFIEAFVSTLHLRLIPDVLSAKERARAGVLKVTKYSHPDWTGNK